MSPQCSECSRFVKVKGARHNGAEGYAAAWYAVGECVKHGEVSIDWEWLGDFDPEAVTA